MKSVRRREARIGEKTGKKTGGKESEGDPEIRGRWRRY